MSLSDRVAQLERRLDAALFNSFAQRDARPHGLRNGRWCGKLTSALTAGGTATAEIWIWDIADEEFQVTTHEVEGVRCFWNWPLPDEMPVVLEYIGNVWVVVEANFNGFVLAEFDSTVLTNGGSTYGDIDFIGGTGLNARGFELTDSFEFTALRDGTYLVNTSFFVYQAGADAENEYYLNFVLHRTRGANEHEAEAGRFWMTVYELVTSVTDSGDTVTTDLIPSPWSGTTSNTLIIDVKKDDKYKFKWGRSATNTDYSLEGWFTFTEIPPNSNDGLDEINTDPWTLV